MLFLRCLQLCPVALGGMRTDLDDAKGSKMKQPARKLGLWNIPCQILQLLQLLLLSPPPGVRSETRFCSEQNVYPLRGLFQGPRRQKWHRRYRGPHQVSVQLWCSGQLWRVG